MKPIDHSDVPSNRNTICRGRTMPINLWRTRITRIGTRPSLRTSRTTGQSSRKALVGALDGGSVAREHFILRVGQRNDA